MNSSTRSGSLTYLQAKEINDASNSFLEVLRQGRIKATGRPFFYEAHGLNSKPGNFTTISQEQWIEYEIDEENNSLVDDEMHHAFTDIQISKSELLKLDVDIEINAVINKGGRPASFSDAVWQAVIVDAYEEERPKSLKAWIERVSCLPVWNDKPINDKYIRDRLEPIFEQLFLEK